MIPQYVLVVVDMFSKIIFGRKFYFKYWYTNTLNIYIVFTGLLLKWVKSSNTYMLIQETVDKRNKIQLTWKNFCNLTNLTNMYAYHKLYAFILLFFENVSLGIMVEIAVSLVCILILELVVSKIAAVVRNNVICRLDVQVSGFIWCQCKGKDNAFIN